MTNVQEIIDKCEKIATLAKDQLWKIVRGEFGDKEFGRVMIRYLANKGKIIHPIEHYRSRSQQHNTITRKRNGKATRQFANVHREVSTSAFHAMIYIDSVSKSLKGADRRKAMKIKRSIMARTHYINFHIKQVKRILDDRSTKISIVEAERKLKL